MKVSCKNIPLYDLQKKEWSSKSFNDQIEFGTFLFEHCYKDCGEYEFGPFISEWQLAAKHFEQHKVYTFLTPRTSDADDWWDFEKKKNRLGVLYKNNDNYYYLTRDYYFLLNYCPITNKEKGFEESFVTVRDGQYHMMLYEKIAEIFHMNSCILKRRQFLFSLCHVAKSVNYLYFENKKRIKWFASDATYLDDVSGDWSVLNQYKTHLNNHTPWAKVFNPDKSGDIQQKEKVAVNVGQWEWEGNESSIIAKTTNKDAQAGVGGATYWAFYEEGGIAPTADITLQFMEPAITSGLVRVGSFCIGGSVGDLTDCKPLQEFIMYPERYGFFAVPTKWFDKVGAVRNCGLFIPAQYSMPEATDEWGNSNIKLALELLYKAEFVGFKKGEGGRIQDEKPWKDLPSKDYITKKSQNPKTIEEAFAYRNDSKFPVSRIEKQQGRIKDNIISKGINVELFEKENGKIGWNVVNKEEMNYPVDPKCEDKSGVVTIYIKPPENPEIGVFFGGFDTIEANTTESSDSLFAGYIFKAARKEYYTDPEDFKTKVRYYNIQLAAKYVGRIEEALEGTRKTNTIGEHLIKLYNAKSLIERNKPNFINHLRDKGLAHLMFKEYEIPFFKDAVLEKDTHKDYGIHMDSTGRKQNHLIDIILEYFSEELDVKLLTKEDGTITDKIIKTTFGIERIPDYWFLEECKLWYKGRNADRMVGFGLGLITAKTMQTSGYIQTDYNIDKSKTKKAEIVQIPKSLFGNRSNTNLLNNKTTRSLIGRN